MYNKTIAALSEYRMLHGKSCVIVALSGGADSMSLLDFLVKNSDALGITVKAAHLNHLLRGEESERDFNFVVDYCSHSGIELYTKRVDIAGLAAKQKIGLEECGRKERYKFFSELSSDEKTVIATAHTASDNAETVMLNIARGCGINGLCGIPPVRGKIIRPLINCSRSEIEAYCAENNVPYITDSSNLTEDYSRNKIRLSVLPNLRMINPSVESSINRLSEIASDAQSFIAEETERAYLSCKSVKGLNSLKLKECSKYILYNVIRAAVEREFGLIPEYRHIELIRDIIYHGHGAVQLGKNMTVRLDADTVVFDKTVQSDKSDDISLEIPFKIDSTISFNSKIYSFTPQNDFFGQNNGKINKKLLNQYLSCDIITSGMVVRTVKSGDIFSPARRNCTKTVKKLFTELKLPKSERGSRLMLASGNRVYWIEGIGSSEEALPKEGCSGVFTVEIKDVANV